MDKLKTLKDKIDAMPDCPKKTKLMLELKNKQINKFINK